MAARTFLTEHEISQARQQSNVALFLDELLLKKLKSYKGWEESQPIALGSWARHEICAKSDIDLLMVGDESAIKEWMAQAQQAGLKVRARIPENANDWTVGVEPFDVLALLNARPLTDHSSSLLRQQIQIRKKWKPEILKAIRKEREERRQRLDGIANYLEPNIKYGSGGLRDVEQALAIQPLYADRFDDTYATDVLNEVKAELLKIRQTLHLKGGGDILSASDQMELWQPFGFASHKEFMRHLQNQLERASFYADWVVARCQVPKKRHDCIIGDIEDALHQLKKPDILNQYEIRRLMPKLTKGLSAKDRGVLLQKAAKPERGDDFLVALYRTRFLEKMLPGFKNVKGLVQHDHYHRFTVDAHLLQALREAQRAESRPKTLGKLAIVAKRLHEKDWWILKLTALFHDLAKGREGDHSTEGSKLVEKTFSEWAFAENIKDDVQWLVLNHLILSTAAFRRNPKDKSTWRMLMDRGVSGRRLDLLTIFTAVDIRATNPEAWTPWKAQLLCDLNANMNSEPVQNLERLLKKVPSKNLQLKETLLKLDPLVVENISAQVLYTDISEALKSKSDLPPRVLRDKKNQLWVRFHSRSDSPGLFLSYVQKLFGFGLPVRVAAVMTIEDVGVYDWFLLKSKSEPKQISKWLSLPKSTSASAPKVPIPVRFDSIEVIAEDDENWIFSFRGRDQKGLLLSAASQLFALGLSIRWAQVHTWGQQIDDIFCVRKGADIGPILKTLREHFVT